jgi:8-oxo-dGTP pyrophosphatase MutT (NUDIX family)
VERRTIAHQPDVPEGVDEAALATGPPRHGVIANRIVAVGAGVQGTLHERVGVLGEDLDADRRGADLRRALPPPRGVRICTIFHNSFVFGSELRARIAANLATHRPVPLHASDARLAAIGVVLVADDVGQACFVLTRRASTLRRHSGQWALPGGRIDAGETPQNAARREIQEEVGLDVSPSAALGRLDDFLTRSRHVISPFVFWADGPNELVANPQEVAAVYRVPLADLERPGNPLRDPLVHFALLDFTVYAPTAALLLQFRELALHGRHVTVSHEEQPRFAWH